MSVNNPKCPENQSKTSRKFECTLIDANNRFTDRSHERLSTFCHWAVFPGWSLYNVCHDDIVKEYDVFNISLVTSGNSMVSSEVLSVWRTVAPFMHFGEVPSLQFLDFIQKCMYFWCQSDVRNNCWDVWAHFLRDYRFLIVGDVRFIQVYVTWNRARHGVYHIL